MLTWCLREIQAVSGTGAMPKITKRLIDSAEAQSKDYVIWDDELPGFGVRVFTSGKRSYVSGTPAETKPTNIGTAEQEQNGVTMPSDAAAMLPNPSRLPASTARVCSGEK